MLTDTLTGFSLVLGSGSPRRASLLSEMGLKFEIRIPDVEEVVPRNLSGTEIPDYLARLKADQLVSQLTEKEILITADTIVWYEGRLLEKPRNASEARQMLRILSDDWHEVITSVCCTTLDDQQLRHETTLVRFRRLLDEEIDFYIREYPPLDKAGAYGIQDWIGLVGITEISGSYTNVVGLPTASLWEMLRVMVS